MNRRTPDSAPYQGNLVNLHSHPLWVSLTDRQRIWLIHYLEHRDAVGAGREASQTDNPDTALNYSRRCLKHPTILRLISDYDGVPFQSPDRRNLTKTALQNLLIGRLLSRQGVMNDRCFYEMTAQLIELKGWRGLRPADPDVPQRTGRPPKVPEDIFERVRAMEQRAENVEE